MKKLPLAALAFTAALFATPALAQESPVVGVWNTQAVTDFGTFASTMTVLEDEGSYIVMMEDVPPPGAPAGGEAPASEITEVAVDGSTFSFKRHLESPMGPMDLTYVGSVEGDALTASVTTSFGTIPVTGTRTQ